MSDARPEPEAPSAPTSLRQAVSSAGLLVVVVAILAWSRWIRSGPPEHRPSERPPAVPSVAARPPAGFASLEPAPLPALPERRADAPPAPPAAPPEPARDPALDALAARASDDVARLSKRRDAWTLQVSRHCSTGLVQDKLRRHGASPNFLLLPVEQDERACFIVCWGVYADRAAASKQASRVPAALRGDGRPFAKAVAKVLP